MSQESCRPPPALAPSASDPSHWGFVNEAPAHGAEIEALLHRAFGPGRFAKVSERVREFADFAPDLSFCALEAGKVVGVVRMWRVAAGDRPVVFLGPLAVEATERRHGLGAQLVERACQASEAAGETAVVLVGDAAYFERVGFAVAADVTLPGPVDPARILFRSFAGAPVAGPVRPR